MFRSIDTLKGPAIFASAAILVGTANAQAVSTSAATNEWRFTIDTSSAGYDLSVTNVTEQTYHLTQTGGYAGPGLESWQTGTGTTQALAPIQYYDANTWSGTNSVISTASSGVAGSAFASTGNMVSLLLTNTGSLPVDLDLTSTVLMLGLLNGSYASDYASGGLNASDQNGSWSISPNNVLSGDTNTGFTLTNSGGYTTIPYGYAPGSDNTFMWSFAVAAGDPVTLSFYVDSADYAQAVPTPPSALTLAVGLAGLAAMRRRRNRQRD